MPSAKKAPDPGSAFLRFRILEAQKLTDPPEHWSLEYDINCGSDKMYQPCNPDFATVLGPVLYWNLPTDRVLVLADEAVFYTLQGRMV